MTDHFLYFISRTIRVLTENHGTGLDLTELSLDTVKTFSKDAADAGFKL